MIKLILPNERPVSRNKFWSGMHWARRKAEADRVHTLVYYEAQHLKDDNGDLPVLRFPVHITVTAYFDHHPQDAGNVNDKPYVDALISVGLLPDDDIRYVRPVTTDSQLDRDDPRVEIVLEYNGTAKGQGSV